MKDLRGDLTERNLKQPPTKNVSASATDALHTPGPWTWEQDYLRGSSRYVIHLGVSYDDAYMDARQEDRDLIAAAPDLLAALEALVNDAATRIASSDEMIEAARLAIVKARGS